MSAKQCDKQVAGNGKAIIYFWNQEPIAVYLADNNILYTGTRVSHPDGWGNLPMIAMQVAEELDGQVEGMPLGEFKSLVSSYVEVPKSKAKKKARPKVKPEPVLETDPDDREGLVLGAVELAVSVSGDMVTVAEIRARLLASSVHDAAERWVHDLVYRLYKAGKLQSMKRGSKRVYCV
jgi:hypothetical protein